MFKERSPPIYLKLSKIGEETNMKNKKYKEYQLNDNQTISFVDSKGYKQCLVIDHMLYKQLHNFELQDKKEMNEYDRHIEHLEQTEIALYKKTKNRYVSLEDIVLTKIINEKLYEAIINYHRNKKED